MRPGYIQPFQKIMHGTSIHGNIIQISVKNEEKKRRLTDMSVWFLLPPDCQSRPCCLAGYMTLSVPTRIMMEIIRKARQRLLHRFFRSRSRSTEMGITYLPPCQPQIIFCSLFLKSYSNSDLRCICARGKVQKLENPLLPPSTSPLAPFSPGKYLHHSLH